MPCLLLRSGGRACRPCAAGRGLPPGPRPGPDADPPLQADQGAAPARPRAGGPAAPGVPRFPPGAHAPGALPRAAVPLPTDRARARRLAPGPACAAGCAGHLTGERGAWGGGYKVLWMCAQEGAFSFCFIRREGAARVLPSAQQPAVQYASVHSINHHHPSSCRPSAARWRS